MKVNPHFDLILYGVLLAVLGVVAHRLAPDWGDTVLITGIAGSAFALLWGALGLFGRCRHRWPIGTLIVLDAALLIQGVRVWREVIAGADALRPVGLILTVLLGAGICELANFLRAGTAEEQDGASQNCGSGAEGCRR